ncbi:hypothetical protein [Streptomyces sp. NPDC046685]|uniref:hypothetical protein n=1 Tax=Streptomyces sp. NPDC046685 TaxID=3157202 RepID=UPI00340C26BB
MSRTSIRTKLAAVAATGVLALGTGVLAASPAQASATGDTYKNCSYGAGCIYAGANWDGWPKEYFSRGTHKLYNQYGTHRVFNNQSPNWYVKLCRNSDGTNCDITISPWHYRDVDLGPYNSVKIVGP